MLKQPNNVVALNHKVDGSELGMHNALLIENELYNICDIYYYYSQSLGCITIQYNIVL